MKQILIVVIILINLISCSAQQTEQINSVQQREQAKPIRMVGMELKLADETALTKNQFTFKLTGNSFSPVITITSKYPEEVSYALLFLLDYEQIAVLHNGEKKSIINTKIAPDSKESFKITISDIPSGRHDFITILVRKPEVNLTKNEFIPPERVYIARRGTLIVESDVTQQPKFASVIGKESKLPREVEFITYNEKPTGLKEALSLVSNTSSNNLWMHFISTKAGSRFAITGYLDYQQVNDITPNRFVQASSAGLVTLPLNLRVPKDNQPHDLLLIVTESPYDELENAQGEYLPNRL